MKHFLFIFFVGFLVGCAQEIPSSQKKNMIGEFRLGHSVVVGKEMIKGPMSRKADPKKITAVVKEAIVEKLSTYKGDQYYHVAVKIDAYILGRPGVPLLFSPKSALVMQITVWDDFRKSKINENPHQIVVLESLSVNTLIGSGLTQSAEMQLANLGAETAIQIENWILQQHETLGWFDKRSK